MKNKTFRTSIIALIMGTLMFTQLTFVASATLSNSPLSSPITQPITSPVITIIPSATPSVTPSVKPTITRIPTPTKTPTKTPTPTPTPIPVKKYELSGKVTYYVFGWPIPAPSVNIEIKDARTQKVYKTSTSLFGEYKLELEKADYQATVKDRLNTKFVPDYQNVKLTKNTKSINFSGQLRIR